MKKITTFILIALIFPTLSSAKMSVRCKGHTMNVGTKKYDVLKYCGEPKSKKIIGSETTRYETGKGEDLKEEWYYEDLSHGDDVIFIMQGSAVAEFTVID